LEAPVLLEIKRYIDQSIFPGEHWNALNSQRNSTLSNNSPVLREPLLQTPPSKIGDIISSRPLFQLRIVRQPPNRTVYQRILKPFPSVMLIIPNSEPVTIGGIDSTNGDSINSGRSINIHFNLFVEVSLIRNDNEVELDCLEGNKIVRVSGNGIFATFKRLKILSTSQQMGTSFRLKFILKRYAANNQFETIGTAIAISSPIDVFSHTLYLNEKNTVFPSFPTVNEILPSEGKAGARVAILGANFLNGPKLQVKIGGTILSSCHFHEQGTLICTIPPMITSSSKASFPIQVTNDGVNYCETQVYFTYSSI